MNRMEKNIAVICNPLAGAGKALPLAEKIAEVLTGYKITNSLHGELAG